MKNIKTLKGFTLIELIVVIAVLGILSAVVIVAVNPLEQLSRGRDASRKSAVSQLGRAIANYFTAQGSTYPAVNASWQTNLQTSGDIKALALNPNYASAGNNTNCNTANTSQNGYCFNTAVVSSNTEAAVYVKLESTAEKNKCLSTEGTWYTWETLNGGAGVVCTTNGTTDPTVSLQTFK